MTSVNSNTFPFLEEGPRTNLLRDVNRPPPFYFEACRVVDEQEHREERAIGYAERTERVERTRIALAYQAWRRDCEDFTKHKVQIMGTLPPRVIVTFAQGAPLKVEPALLPPDVQATFDMLDAMALQRAEWYGLTLKHPESEIRRD